MPKYTKEQIFDKMVQVNSELKSKGFDVFYIALYGSQNYGIDTETSDIDLKAIIIPTLEQLVRQTKPTSTVFNYEWGQVEVKDIRNYIESAVKVNGNFIELLNTEYYLSPYQKEAEVLRSFYSRLLDSQWEIYLRACQWMVMQKFHALRHPFPSKLDVIGTYGYDPKQLCHIIRLTLLMERYLNKDYSFIHTDVEKDFLINVKNGLFLNSEADEVAEGWIANSKKIIEEYTTPSTFETKTQLIEFSRNIIINSIKNEKANQSNWGNER